VLHREEVVAVLEADVVDLRDVRVVQRRREARFVEEHVDELRVRRELREDALDHGELLEPLDADGAREIELRHPPDRDLANQVVLAQLVAWAQVTSLEWRCFHHPTHKDRRNTSPLQYNPRRWW